MLAAIKLNYHLFLKTNKINDVILNLFLAAKFFSFHLSVTQVIPQLLFSVSLPPT